MSTPASIVAAQWRSVLLTGIPLIAAALAARTLRGAFA
jgi:hypothetical protein